MKSYYLLKELTAVFEREIGDLFFPHADGTDRPLHIYLHAWPQDQTSDVFPSICIRWGGSEMGEEEAEAHLVDTVAIALGVYAPDNQEEAGLLLAQLNDAVMTTLNKYRLLANQFQRIYPVRSEQPSPDRKWSEYHAATIVTQWDYMVPVTPLYNGNKLYNTVEADYD